MNVNPLGIDPAIIKFDQFLGLFPLEVRWYGLMYVLGFVFGSMLLKRLSKTGFLPMTKVQIDQYVTRLMLGMFLGARFFYVFIYNWDYYSHNFGDIFSVWKGGLSFHGALFGMCMATLYTAKRLNLHFFQVSDSLALAGTQGLFWGRMGNFINGELYGRVTDSPLGMIFPLGGPYPRHASQLYEGLMEGILLFAILWIFVKPKQKHYGVVSAVFMLGYGVFRYIVEFFREPDSQLGYYLGGTTTMGQILCLIMVVVSYFIYLWARKASVPTVKAGPDLARS